MPKTRKQIPLRLEESQYEKLRKWADHFEVTDVQMVRWACSALLRYIEMHDGHVPLPVDFTKMWSSIDAAEAALRKGMAEEDVEEARARTDATLRKLGYVPKEEMDEAIRAAENGVKYKAGRKSAKTA